MYAVQHFHVMAPLTFRNQETVQYFLNAFNTKTRLSQALFLDVELLKLFPTILDIKNTKKEQKIFFSK